MSKIRLGVLGGGGDSLIGVLHRVASYMYDRYQIVGGVFNPNYDENIKFAKQIGISTERVYENFDKFIILTRSSVLILLTLLSLTMFLAISFAFFSSPKYFNILLKIQLQINLFEL